MSHFLYCYAESHDFLILSVIMLSIVVLICLKRKISQTIFWKLGWNKTLCPFRCRTPLLQMVPHLSFGYFLDFSKFIAKVDAKIRFLFALKSEHMVREILSPLAPHTYTHKHTHTYFLYIWMANGSWKLGPNNFKGLSN